jgi:hypothetical protein
MIALQGTIFALSGRQSLLAVFDLPRCIGAKNFLPLLAISGQMNCPCGVKKNR